MRPAPAGGDESPAWWSAASIAPSRATTEQAGAHRAGGLAGKIRIARPMTQPW